jgi:hypothetical protein
MSRAHCPKIVPDGGLTILRSYGLSPQVIELHKKLGKDLELRAGSAAATVPSHGSGFTLQSLRVEKLARIDRQIAELERLVGEGLLRAEVAAPALSRNTPPKVSLLRLLASKGAATHRRESKARVGSQ